MWITLQILLQLEKASEDKHYERWNTLLQKNGASIKALLSSFNYVFTFRVVIIFCSTIPFCLSHVKWDMVCLSCTLYIIVLSSEEFLIDSFSVSIVFVICSSF